MKPKAQHSRRSIRFSAIGHAADTDVDQVVESSRRLPQIAPSALLRQVAGGEPVARLNARLKAASES